MHEVNIRVYSADLRYQGFVDDTWIFRIDIEANNGVSSSWCPGSEKGEITPSVDGWDTGQLLDLESKPCVVREQGFLVVIDVFAPEISIRTLAKCCPEEMRYAVAPLETSAEDIIRNKDGSLEENNARSRRLRPFDYCLECALPLCPVEPICNWLST